MTPNLSPKSSALKFSRVTWCKLKTSSHLLMGNTFVIILKYNHVHIFQICDESFKKFIYLNRWSVFTLNGFVDAKPLRATIQGDSQITTQRRLPANRPRWPRIKAKTSSFPPMWVQLWSPKDSVWHTVGAKKNSVSATSSHFWHQLFSSFHYSYKWEREHSTPFSKEMLWMESEVPGSMKSRKHITSTGRSETLSWTKYPSFIAFLGIGEPTLPAPVRRDRAGSETERNVVYQRSCLH